MRITKESILSDLENDRLTLPSLPEVAIKVREQLTTTMLRLPILLKSSRQTPHY